MLVRPVLLVRRARVPFNRSDIDQRLALGHAFPPGYLQITVIPGASSTVLRPMARSRATSLRATTSTPWAVKARASSPTTRSPATA
ncbi:MAG: hypothetical protein OZ921_21785, partial [Sorangiineae bacterium]|nr:hypothetical protein [Sorangiineae bacterium]